MPDTPTNPPPPDPPQGPWVYSGIPSGGFYAPTPPPAPASVPPTPSSPTNPPPAASSPPRPPPHQRLNPNPPPLRSLPSPLPPPPPPPASAAQQPPKQAPQKPEQDDTSLAGVIDTIEAIIIALIVALTFRAFIVEAFVIPTGSMAPTLLGAHYKVICPKCGYEFDLEAKLGYQVQGNSVARMGDRSELGANRAVPLDDEAPILCPNCRNAIAAKDLPQYLETKTLRDDRNAGAQGPVRLAWANNGDRILVLKYLYSVMEPKRWDVIVFKEPQKALDNYIKRLIGLPGETVQVVNGDIYIQPPGSKDPRDRVIQRKPEEIQKCLWQLVYDNDYYPIDEGQPRTQPAESKRRVPMLPWLNPWEPAPEHAADWKKGPTMAYSGIGAGALQFHPLTPGAPAGYAPYGLNTLGYNSDLYVDDMVAGQGEFAPRSIVGDLRLETLWTTPREGAKPAITLTLGRPNNCYQVAWGTQGLALARYDVANKKFVPVAGAQTIALPGIGAGGAAMPAPEPGHSYHLALNNVDHAIQFYIDGIKTLWFEEHWDAQMAIQDLQDFPADWTNSPSEGAAAWAQRDQARVNTMIQIDVSGPCELSHLKLWRDLYYTQVTPIHQEFSGWRATGTQDNPVTLGPDEFFAMGDNSRRSSDGRLWSSVHDPLEDLGLRPGIVPRRYLLGKAFFVYWPAGFTPVAPQSQVFLLRDLPLVPNAGAMRIIR